MSGDVAAVPAQTASPKDGGGKTTADFISADTRISETGAVTGTLKYVESLASFGGKGGHFFPITLGNQYAGKQITTTGVNGPKQAVDLEWLCEIADTGTTVKFEAEGEEILTLSFKGAVFQPQAGKVSTKKKI